MLQSMAMGDQNGRACKLAFTKPLQGFVCTIEAKRLDADRYGNTLRQLHELSSVLASQIGNGTDDAFTPQKFVGHRGNTAHVNPPKYKRSALHESLER